MTKEEIREIVKEMIEDGTIEIKVDVYTSRMYQDSFGNGQGALDDVEVYCELGVKGEADG